MSNILSYEFEELPLVISNGIEAAFINGMAEVQYSRDGSWFVQDVSVEGFGDRVNGKRQWLLVRAPYALEDIITDRLKGEWSCKVQDAINEQLASDREGAADDRADMRRDHMMGM